MLTSQVKRSFACQIATAWGIQIILIEQFCYNWWRSAFGCDMNWMLIWCVELWHCLWERVNDHGTNVFGWFFLHKAWRTVSPEFSIFIKSSVDEDVVFDVSFSQSIRHRLLLISVRVDFPLTSKAGDGFFIPSRQIVKVQPVHWQTVH